MGACIGKKDNTAEVMLGTAKPPKEGEISVAEFLSVAIFLAEESGKVIR